MICFVQGVGLGLCVHLRIKAISFWSVKERECWMGMLHVTADWVSVLTSQPLISLQVTLVRTTPRMSEMSPEETLNY